MFMQLPSNLYEEVQHWMMHARIVSFNNIRDRQIKKFEHLKLNHHVPDDKNDPIITVNNTEKDQLRSKWVINLSDHELSMDEIALLRRGLNFAITPQKTPINEYVIGIKSACKCIGSYSKAAERLRSDCVRILQNHKPTPSNISKKERAALRELAKDDKITILPADKGCAVVVMNTADYKQKATMILSDTTTYKVLKKDPTPRLTYSLRSCRNSRILRPSQTLSTNVFTLLPTLCLFSMAYQKSTKLVPLCTP